LRHELGDENDDDSRIDGLIRDGERLKKASRIEGK